MASSLPIIRLTETVIAKVSAIGKAGAVTGGGLTVIANSPNPAGQSILASRFGEAGISPLYLFLGVLVPTLIAGAAFMFLP
jgi:hypothetical protein